MAITGMLLDSKVLGPFTDKGALAACCCQGFLLLGYDQGVMSGIVSTVMDHILRARSN